MKAFARLAAVFILIGFFVVGLHLRDGQIQLVPAARAASHPDEFSLHSCMLRTIEGSFGISSTGSIVSAGPVGLVADVGVITFDGNGGASQVTTVSLNGTIIPNRTSLAGTYTVNPDCTGELAITLPTPTGPSPSNSHFVIVAGGDQLLLINSGAGRVIAGAAIRQHSGRW